MQHKNIWQSLLLSCWLFSGHAAADGYQVELLIFKYLRIDAGGETWGHQRVPDYSNAVELATGEETTLRKLPINRYRLGGVYQILEISADYLPLHHTAWEQLTEAKAVRINAPELHIDGAVKLQSRRLLLLDVDLSYVTALPANQPGSENGDTQKSRVRIKESRRIKLNELHYFDHPVFGLLVQVTRGQIEP